MSSIRVDLTGVRIFPEPEDHFDLLPDSILLLVFNKIGDVKVLGRCCVVSKRFHSLVSEVENVVVRVDCVISDDDNALSSSSSSSVAGAVSSTAVGARSSSAADKSRNLLRIFFSSLLRPIQSITQLISSNRKTMNSLNHDMSSGCSATGDDESDCNSVTHHSPTQVLKNFNEIKSLRIELPAGELGVDDGVLLKWRANFGSTLDTCVILGASSITRNQINHDQGENAQVNGPTGNVSNSNASESDNGSIPESFYTNGGLKLRVVWTISSLIAASARHYLLQPIISDHKTLDKLLLTDADGQGVLCMNREQLEELRVKPLSASSASKRTLVPALSMRLWYAPHLELPDGTVLKGATLVAIRPSGPQKKEVALGSNLVASAFEEPYGTAARMLVKRRTYCLEMNSF